MDELQQLRDESINIAEMAFAMNDASGVVSALLSIDAAEYLMNDVQ